jgi:hypothetical protein
MNDQWANERKDLIKQINDLKAALQGLWMHIESGTLCRDTSRDHDDDWSIMASALVSDLKRAHDVLFPTGPKPE